MAKMYGGKRPLKEIRSAVKAKRWSWDDAAYEAGSDWVTFEFRHQGQRLDVIYSGFNGRFMTRSGDQNELITEESVHMDGTPWYDALLDFVYLPKAAKKAA